MVIGLFFALVAMVLNRAGGLLESDATRNVTPRRALTTGSRVHHPPRPT